MINDITGVLIYQKDDPVRPLIEVLVKGRKVWVEGHNYDALYTAMLVAYSERFKSILEAHLDTGCEITHEASDVIERFNYYLSYGRKDDGRRET